VRVIETERLNLRNISADDAAFVLELLNDPSFISFIGDRGVRTIEDAQQYILTKMIASYERFGFGMWLVELRDSKVPIGICGLVKRDSLPNVDIGFAFLPRFRSMGYASESASAVKNYGMNVIGLTRLLAITNQDNSGSIKVLEKIGLRFDRMIRLAEGADEIKLFASDV